MACGAVNIVISFNDLVEAGSSGFWIVKYTFIFAVIGTRVWILRNIKIFNHLRLGGHVAVVNNICVAAIIQCS
jgi:hypothetical protein